MRLTKWLTIMVVVVLCLGLALTGCAKKNDAYPSQPIEYVVHSSAGGSSDIFTRTITDFLAKEKLITVPFTVVNKTGGGGAVAYQYTRDQKGNPYVLQNIPSTFITTPIITKDCPGYEDLTMIANLVIEPDCVIVSAKSKYYTIDDLIADCKNTSGGLNLSTSSIGSYDHLAEMLFNKAIGVDNVIIPNDSDGEAMVAVLGGHVAASFLAPRVVMPQVLAGELRVLAITGDKRFDDLPDVPTLKEMGIDVVISTPRGVAAPPDIPAEAKDFLINTYVKLSETATWKEYIKKEFAMPYVLTGADYTEFMKAETEKVRPLLEEAGLIEN